MESSTPPTTERAGENAAAGSSASSASASSLAPAGAQAGAAGVPAVPERSPSRSSLRHSTSSHRHSFAENLRNPPPSPRSLRQPSFTQQVQGLLNHPPPQRQPQARFANRDWHDISLGELVSEEDVRWANLDTSVEDCTKTLLRGTNTAGAVLVRKGSSDKMAVSTFDYSDLNAYLLIVIGMASPEPEQVAACQSIAQRAQDRVAIPVRDVLPVCHKEPLAMLSYNDDLLRVIEVFGSGARRVVVTNANATEVVGVLSQLHLIQFFWNEAVNFPQIDRLYAASLRDLQLGSKEIIAINADRPLSDALTLMHSEGLTSVAVVDNGLNVVGNISTRDVQHLTSVTSFPLLQSSCMHFISVILSERGVEEGRDSFPVFHVNPHSTLAHTVAKLVATRSHRMWVVDSPSPSPSASAPQTPLLSPVQAVSSVSSASSSAPAALGHSRSPSGAGLTGNTASANGTGEGPAQGHACRESTVLTPSPSATAVAPQSPVPLPSGNGAPGFNSVPAAALPGAHLSGRLTGVVSLTDILNLFAKTTGLRPSDPADIRARRRRSSSSSLRPSLDGVRTSMDMRR
ncbi:cell separation during budding [Sporothrix curviconia]|uniref:Protein SDS23 n=1 Tax=Sporothrix curviconia TaxID=1260050 RepID=A0ABP0ANF3_9PEZI